MATGGTSRECGETLADRVFTVTAMLGAIGGAAGGAVLGAETGNVFPILCGTLGTVFGSTFAAGVWYLLVRLWAGDGTDHNPRDERSHAVHSQSATPAPSAG